MDQFTAHAIVKNDKRALALSLAVTQVSIDAMDCGLGQNIRGYRVTAEPYPWPDDSTSDTWRVTDNADGDLAELEWDAPTQQWDRRYLNQVFSELMELA